MTPGKVSGSSELQKSVSEKKDFEKFYKSTKKIVNAQMWKNILKIKKEEPVEFALILNSTILLTFVSACV